MEPLAILLLIGAAGGIVRAILGYQAQADEGEVFDPLKAARSMLRAAVIGSFIVFGSTALTQSPITPATYIMAFFLSVGADVLVKEGYGVVKS